MNERLEIGNAIVYHADAYEVRLHLSPQDFGLLLTDPMYGMGAEIKGKTKGRGAVVERGAGRLLKGMAVHQKDWQIDEDLQPFNPTPFLAFRKIILWGGNHFAHLLPPSPKWLVWNKRPRGAPSDDNSDCELAWTNIPGKAIRQYDHLWRGICREGRENLSRGGAKLHPFQKPVGLGKFCIAQAKLEPGEMVVDFFGGSGAFAVAALEMGHPVVIVEKERHFFEVICEQVERAQVQLSMLDTESAA